MAWRVPTVKRNDYLARSEIAQLFRIIKKPRDRALFRLIYHRGMRSSEPGLLRLEDWDERRALLSIPRKQNSLSTRQTLLPVEMTALRAWIKVRGRAPGPLFPSRQRRAHGLGIHRNRLDQLFREYCRAAGIRPEKSHLNALRTSCGVHLHELSEDVTIIQQWMGLRALGSVHRYLKPAERMNAAVSERLRKWK